MVGPGGIEYVRVMRVNGVGEKFIFYFYFLFFILFLFFIMNGKSCPFYIWLICIY